MWIEIKETTKQRMEYETYVKAEQKGKGRKDENERERERNYESGRKVEDKERENNY